MKKVTSWHSERVGREVTVARWGFYGLPVLIFPTAGGDAEEIERFHVIKVLEDLIQDGKIKVYSCDSVAGRVLLTREGTNRHQCHLMNQFHQFIRHEMVPAIRMDCDSSDIEIAVAGSSIGAWNALSVICRFPEVFSKAICMSGTYRIERFLEGSPTEDFFQSSAVHFLPELDGPQLEQLRKRFILFPCGRGRAEDIGESWYAAHLLGQKGVPNRVDDWGEEWPHDWPTWRNMLPKYLGELTTPAV